MQRPDDPAARLTPLSRLPFAINPRSPCSSMEAAPMKPRVGAGMALLALVWTTALPAQTRIITGRVTDSLTSEAITSGQVSVQGSSIGTVIKNDGTFTLAA